MITSDTLLGSITKAPISHEQLRKYAVASTDHNAIHLDDAAAKSAGLPGVIAHGMLTMAFMTEFLHANIAKLFGASNGRISEISCRFKGMTFPGDEITIAGKIKSVRDDDTVDCTIEAKNQNGDVTATGSATLSRLKDTK